MTTPTSGRVADGHFARVFADLALRQVTGILRLEQDGRRLALYWQEGAIADADSSNPEDTLGRVALEAGILESSVVGDSLRRMAQNPTRSQKDILVDLGALRGEALDHALRLTLTRRALRAFAMPGASYTVEEVPHCHMEGGPVEPRWSLYRGLRSHYDERRLEAEMADLAGHALKLAVDPAEIFEAFGFSDDERALLGYLARGYWELFDLVEACTSLPRGVVLAVVHALHVFENLDVQPAIRVSRLRKRAREGPSTSQQINRSSLGLELKPQTSSPSSGLQVTAPRGASRSAPPVMDGGSSQPVAPVEPRVAPLGTGPPVAPFTGPAGLDPTTQPGRPALGGPLLPGLSPNAGPEAQPGSRPGVRAGTLPGAGGPGSSRPGVAFTPPTGTPKPVRHPSESSAPVAPAGSTPRRPPSGPHQPFGANQRVATDAGVRGPGGAIGGAVGGAISGALRDQIAAKLAAVDANVDHFALLEIGREAGSAQVKDAYLKLAKTYHPDRLVLVKLEALRPQVERIFARLSDAYAALGDDGRRREYLSVMAQGGEAAVKRRENDDAARATRVLTAEEHFKKGEMALRRQNYAGAVEEFQVAVELNDGEAEHYALLAWAKFLNASDKKAVMTEVQSGFKKAMKLNDRCIPAFFHLGQVYRAIGENAKAYSYFQKVLSLNENHVDAAREVRLIDMRKKGGKGGIFDLFRKK